MIALHLERRGEENNKNHELLTKVHESLDKLKLELQKSEIPGVWQPGVKETLIRRAAEMERELSELSADQHKREADVESL